MLPGQGSDLGRVSRCNGTSVSCAATAPSPTLACASINADGEVATTTYGDDSDGEQTSTTSPDGNLTGADAGNYTTTTAYNADGKKTTVTQAGGTGATVTPRATTYGYDADGNQTTVEDARGYTTTTSYNANNEAALVTNPDGDAALTCYDGDGNVAQTVPAVGVAADSLTTASCPTSYPAGYTDRLAADATVNTYDAAGNKTASSTPAPAGLSGSELTSYAYDSDGNLIETTAPPASNAGGAPDQVTYDTYNDAGQQATQTTGYGTSAASTTAYCYDPEGDKTAVVAPDGNASGAAPCQASSPWNISASANPAQAAYQTTHGYDSAGEVVSTTTPATSAAPGGATTTSTYDPAGNMTAVTDPDGITTTGNKIAITSTADGLPSAETLGSTGDSIITGYDQTDNPSAIALENSSSTLQSFTYADAPGGETLTEADTPSSSGSPAAYGYDAQGRVTSLTPGSGTASTYGFDASGNLTTLPGGAAGTYDDAGEITSSALAGTTTTYTYNADGERVGSAQGSTVTSATWNGGGQLTGYDSPAADMIAAAYNGDGLRTSDTTGGTSQDFAWNGDKLLMDGASAYIYAAGTTPAEQVSLSTGTVTYLVSDALGSVRGTVSSTGALTGTTSYDAWGNPSTAAGLTAATPFGYAGAYTDPDGLLYLINRYYDPATGQFISVDPYLDQTNAPYTCADGNPVTNTDPTGLTGLNDKPGVLGRSYCYHVVSAQHWNGQVCAQVYVSGLENTLAQAQVVFKVNSGDIYYAAVDTLALEACSNTGPHPGHPVDCKWGYVASSGAFYTDVKTFTVTTSAKFRAIYVTWFRAYAEGVTMVWTNGQYVANGSVYGYLEEDGNGG